MRYVLVLFLALLGSATSAVAQVSIGIGFPGVSIGINLAVYPELVLVPGYPVYYAPRLEANFFFYDGMYWVYQGDNWYASSWYNGPWGLVAPNYVPFFLLRIPVRYYRVPPPYFRGWRPDAPPRWGEHWGQEWEQRRSGWDRWDRNAAPAPAPLPVYQRRYPGNRYPHAEQQPSLHDRNYRYQPRDAVVRQHYEEQAVKRVPVPVPSQRSRPQGGSAGPQPQAPQRGDEGVQRSAPIQSPPRQRGPDAKEHRQPPQQGRGRERDKEREKGEQRGPERNR